MTPDFNLDIDIDFTDFLGNLENKFSDDKHFDNFLEPQKNDQVQKSDEPQSEFRSQINFNEILNLDNNRQLKRQHSTYQSFEEKIFSQKEVYEQEKDSQSDNLKINKKNESAKRYRQKKKQYIKCLEEENKFLRKKVDQLTFRLNETQMTLNRLKHGQTLQSSQLIESRQKCLKQMEQVLSQIDSTKEQDHKKITQIKIKYQSLTSLKQRQSLLNYFMGELLQNVIDDRSLYFMDSMLKKRGIFRDSQKTQLRRIDSELFEVLDIVDDYDKENIYKRSIPKMLIEAAMRFKEMWKNLYLNYLKLINQGFLIESLVKPFKEKIQSHFEVLIPLRVQLYFDKIKYRSDLRKLRSEWYKELNDEEDIKKEISNTFPSKRTKN